MMVAGHSLGEYSALVAAGALGFADALRLVRRRGEAMQAAVPPGEGAMAAVLGLDATAVEQVAAAAAAETGEVCAVANYNSPEQTVVAGTAAAVDRAAALASERGARRAIRLPVSAPFHCALMAPAQAVMAELLAATEFRDPAVPVVVNVDARPVTTGAAAREALVRQVTAPVRWVESVRRLAADGASTIVEVGPGKVLAGLVRRIAPEVATAAVGELEEFRKLPGRPRGGGGWIVSGEAMLRLDGRTALVTGASRGIGEAIALRLAAQGARMVLAARNEDKLQAVAAAIVGAGGEALPWALDLAHPESVGERLSALPAEYTEIDVLVSNAGITADSLLARMSLEDWQRVLTVNLTGAFALSRELVRGMIRRRWGRIVSVSSVVGLMGNPGQANYAAAKAGLVGFSKSLARELASRSITVNVVAPGYIETEMTERLSEAVRGELTAAIPLRRIGRVEDVAAAVAYLASEEAGYVTGTVLNVSGGLYI